MMARKEISPGFMTRDRIALAELPHVFPELLRGSPRTKVIIEMRSPE
jgi:hypothetical protein